MQQSMSELNDALSIPNLSVMNFLNEVSLRYPEAISLAPGRPKDFFPTAQVQEAMRRFVAHFAQQTGDTEHAAWAALGQYGPTNGIINPLVARHLERDEDIRVDPKAIALTHGAQEAMMIVMLGLFRRDEDVLLCTDPCYVGITGVASLLGIQTLPVQCGPDGVTVEAVEAAIRLARAAGKRPRALYDIPDFHNPLGTALPLETRHALLRLAEREQLLVIEDNPYGAFAFDAPPLPTLKALDRTGQVVYLGTFSKTMLPGVRVGYLVADQRLEDGRLLAEELSKVKSLVSVNTSGLLQAAAGGILLEQDCSLKASLQPRLEHYRANRNTLLASLERSFGGVPQLSKQVRWTSPGGGFFLTVTLPFACGAEEAERSAREFGVLFCPMSFFSLTPGREQQIRLSFSSTTHSELQVGVERLARFVLAEMERRGPGPPTAPLLRPQLRSGGNR